MPRQTYLAKNEALPKKQWHHVDADGQILGRMAVKVATVLMGKHRPEYTPHVDTGDFVVVTNAAKVQLTGKKLQHKNRQRYSNYPGGKKTETYETIMKRKPELLIEEAVRLMLPKGRLGRAMFSKLKVYAGAEHPHSAQQPVSLMK